MTAPVAVPAMSDTPPFPALSDRAAGTYNSKAYDFGTHMSDVFNAELLAVAESAHTNAVAAQEVAVAVQGATAAAVASATAAAGSATAAGTSAGAASTSAGAASSSATAAAGSASAAATSAAAAAAAAAGLVASSTSGLLIGLGAKALTTQAGKQFAIGAWVMAASAANPANYMFGQVTSYAGTALVLDVQAVGGSGTFADWALSVSSPRGGKGDKGDKGDQGPAIDYAVLAETILVGLPVATAASSIRHVINIDATRVALILASSTAIQAVCYDRSTKLFGSAVLVRSGTQLFSSASSAGTDKVLVGSIPSGAATFEAVVLSFAGTAITVNTTATANAGENSTVIGMGLNAAIVGSTYVFGITLVTNPRVIAVTISGTVPTIGTSVSPPSSTPTGMIRLKAIDSTRLLAVYTTGSNLVACVITVSGGVTLSPGVASSTAATGTTFWGPYLLSDGRFALAYNNTNSYGAVITATGTTIAGFSTVLLNTGGGGIGSVVKLGDQLLVTGGTLLNALTNVTGVATAGTAIAFSSPALAAYGPDYAAYILGATSYAVVKIASGSPYVPLAGSAGLFSASGIQQDDDLPPMPSLNGKSCSTTSSTTQMSLVFATTGVSPKIRQCSDEPMMGALKMQSAAVGWHLSAGNSNPSNVRLTRVEMV